RPEDPNRLPGLDDERLVLLDRLQRVHDLVEALPVPRCPGSARVDDQLFGVLRVLEVVLEHPQDRLLPPALAAELRPPERLYLSRSCDRHQILPFSRRRPISAAAART